MQASPETAGLVARAANRHLGKSDREAAGVLSAAQRHTHFLDSPRMVAVLGRSDFRFADLKRRNVSVFLVLPPDRLSTYSRWLRLLVAQSLTDMAQSARSCDFGQVEERMLNVRAYQDRSSPPISWISTSMEHV